MATITINRETFTATGTEPLGYRPGTLELGTVEVSIGTKTITAPARRFDDGSVYAKGFVGRYRTSNKPWRAVVRADDRGTYASFGRDDRSGRFAKQSGISWEPETYEAAR